jgi:hypothetical protein
VIRSFDDETKALFLREIEASLAEVRGIKSAYDEFYNYGGKELLIEGGHKNLLDYLSGCEECLERFKIKVNLIYEDAERWDIETQQQLQQVDFELLKFEQNLLATLQCLYEFDAEGNPSNNPPEIITANLAQIEELKEEAYHRSLYLYYSENNRWETIFAKDWRKITEEDILAVQIMKSVFEVEGQQAELNKLIQYQQIKEAEKKASEPIGWSHVNKMWEECQDDPSVSRFLATIRAGVETSCDDIFGKNKKNLARNMIESLTKGTVDVLSFGDK